MDSVEGDSTWEYDGPLAPSGAPAMRFQGRWVDAETGDPIAGPRWLRRSVGPWEPFDPNASDEADA